VTWLAGKTNSDQLVRLMPQPWTRLPDTNIQLLLWGRRRTDYDGVDINRTGGQWSIGGWDLSPVLGLALYRRVPEPEGCRR
jgi:hypothetical protein